MTEYMTGIDPFSHRWIQMNEDEFNSIQQQLPGKEKYYPTATRMIIQILEIKLLSSVSTTMTGSYQTDKMDAITAHRPKHHIFI